MRSALGTLICMLVIACADNPSSAPSVTVRDSAGVTIVRSSAPAWGPGEAWEVALEPSVEIGAMEGNDPDLLFQVEGATRLGDGRIAILNAGTEQIRYFSGSGEFLSSAGGSGEGPGEFNDATGFARRPGDSILVWDFGSCRLSWFDEAGLFVRSTVISEYQIQGEAPSSLPCNGAVLLSHGLLLLTRSVPRDSPLREENPSGVFRPPTRYFLIREEGQLSDSLGIFGGIEQERVGDYPIPLHPPYDRKTRVASVDDPSRTCLGEQVTAEVHCFDSSLNLTLLRWNHAPVPVSSTDLKYWKDHPRKGLALLGEERQARAMDEATGQEFRPPYGLIHLDRDGNLWVQKTVPLGSEPPIHVYWVFDPDGQLLGEVEVPSCEVLEIGPDYLLGLYRGEYDVEFVRLYRIEKR